MQPIVALRTIYSDDAATGFVHPDILAHGWDGFVAKQARPMEAFFDALPGNPRPRYLLWMPDGVFTPPGANLQFDSDQEARRRNLPQARGFVSAWRPVQDDGAELISYKGTFHADPDFASRKPADWLARARASIADELALGCSIAFDYAGSYPVDSLEWQFIEEVRQQTRVYIEPWVKRGFDHANDCNVICTEQFYPHISRGAEQPIELLTGEICRWVQAPDEGWTQDAAVDMPRYVKAVRRVIEAGHTPIVNDNWRYHRDVWMKAFEA